MARSQSWKVEERHIARRLDTVRNPSNGRRQADINAPPFAIECKKWQVLPAWFKDTLAQAQAGCRADEIAMIVFSHAPGRGQPIQRFVVLGFDDFADNVYPSMKGAQRGTDTD